MPASTTLHEPTEKLAVKTIEFHRAIVSLMEELDAVDWYNQRADACTDPELKAILQHNRDEEIEHASMALEWIRRNFRKFDESLKTYLFTNGEITAIEKNATEVDETTEDIAAKPTADREARFTIGEMKGT